MESVVLQHQYLNHLSILRLFNNQQLQLRSAGQAMQTTEAPLLQTTKCTGTKAVEACSICLLLQMAFLQPKLQFKVQHYLQTKTTCSGLLQETLLVYLHTQLQFLYTLPAIQLHLEHHIEFQQLVRHNLLLVGQSMLKVTMVDLS